MNKSYSMSGLTFLIIYASIHIILEITLIESLELFTPFGISEFLYVFCTHHIRFVNNITKIMKIGLKNDVKD